MKLRRNRHRRAYTDMLLKQKSELICKAVKAIAKKGMNVAVKQELQPIFSKTEAMSMIDQEQKYLDTNGAGIKWSYKHWHWYIDVYQYAMTRILDSYTLSIEAGIAYEHMFIYVIHNTKRGNIRG